MLARSAGGGRPLGHRLRRAVGFAAALAVGAATFVLGVGVLLAVGGRGRRVRVNRAETAGLAGHALTSGEFTAATLAFTTTAVVLVVLLFAAARGVATAQQRLVERLQAGAPAVKHWGGYVLALVGFGSSSSACSPRPSRALP